MRAFCLHLLASYATANGLLCGQAADVQWVRRAGGALEDYGWAIARDASNNVIAAGHFTEPAEYENVTLRSRGALDISVAKYDYDGRLLWVQTAGGPGDDDARAVCSDPAGNLGVTGSYAGTVAFQTTTLSNSSPATCYVANYAPDGGLRWAKSSTGAGRSEGRAIAAGGNGTVLAAGVFSTLMTFDKLTATARGANDVFVILFNPEGEPIWLKSFGGEQNDDVGGVTVDFSGNIFMTGSFRGTAQFGSISLTSTGGADAYVAKLDARGDVIWVRSFGGSSTTGVDGGTGIAADFAGNAYVTGVFYSSMQVNGIPVPYAGSGDGFVAKFSSTGSALWARAFGGPSADKGTGVAVDANDQPYVAGFTFDTAQVGAFELRSPGHADVMIARLSLNGEVEWAAQAGGSSYKSANALAVSDSGSCFTTGFFRGTTTFGGFTLTNDHFNNRDIFVARFEGPKPALHLYADSSGRAVRLWWNATVPAFVEQNSSLKAEEWARLEGEPVLDNGRQVFHLSSNSSRYFRLRRD